MSLLWQLNFIVGIECTCIIDHIIVLSSLRHIPHLIRSIMKGKFYFWCRLHLYDCSHHCHIQFSSQIAPGPIDHDNLVLLSVYNVPIQSVMSMFYLVLIVDRTQFDRSRQFNFYFGADYIYRIGHAAILFTFCHRLHMVKQVSIIQFQF